LKKWVVDGVANGARGTAAPAQAASGTGADVLYHRCGLHYSNAVRATEASSAMARNRKEWQVMAGTESAGRIAG